MCEGVGGEETVAPPGVGSKWQRWLLSWRLSRGCGPLSGVDRGQGAELRQQLGVGIQAGQAALLQGNGLS